MRLTKPLINSPASKSYYGQDEPTVSANKEEWNVAQNKRIRKKSTQSTKNKEETQSHGRNGNNQVGSNTNRNKIKRRIPKNAVISITRNDDNKTYAEILKTAKGGVELDSIDILGSKIRRAANGGILIEVPGEDGAAKAEPKLAVQLRSILKDDARVVRPTAKGDLRISGLDDATEPFEVRVAIAVGGRCDVSEVNVGPIRYFRGGFDVVWAKCPLSAAVKFAKMEKVNIGWTRANIELLAAKPLQCYECWHYGHSCNNCAAIFDRGSACFRCGDVEHNAKSCLAQPQCQICKDSKLDHNHRMGSGSCSLYTKAVNLRNNLAARRTNIATRYYTSYTISDK